MTCFGVAQKRLSIRTELFNHLKEMPLLEEYATKLRVEYLNALIIPQQHSFIF